MRLLTMAAALLIAFTGAVGGAAADPPAESGLGPLAVRNMRPYDLLFLQFQPESPDTLPSRRTRWTAQMDISNNLLIPAPDHGVIVVEDNEIQRARLCWRYGIGGRAEVAAYVPVMWRNGGFMDPIMSWWHRAFGIPGNAQDDPAGRDFYPRFRSILGFTDSHGIPVARSGNAFGLGDSVVTWKRELGRSSSRANAAVRLGLKIPTGNPGLLLGSGSADVGLSLDGRYSLTRELMLYGNLGGALLGRATRLPNAAKALGQCMAALEFHPNSRDSFLWQIDGSPAPVRTGNSFADRAQVSATFGYKRLVDRHTLVSASFTENGDITNYAFPYLANIGPDFTVTAGVEWRP